MILWTIQHREAYDKMLETGALRAEESHLFCGNKLRFAYDWIAGQMKKRVGNPPDGVTYPVWAWYQWEGIRKRPDMRGSHKCYSPSGTPIVLLTVDVPDELVLLSDFDMWHCVLGNMYLSVGDESDICYCTPANIRRSWNRIFDIHTHYRDWYAYNEKSIQACVWEIKAEWVKKAEFFTSR